MPLQVTMTRPKVSSEFLASKDSILGYHLDHHSKEESRTYQAKTPPRKNDTATSVPTSMPEPNMAGDHSMIHPQLSAAMAKVGKMPALNAHVKTCQSCLFPRYRNHQLQGAYRRGGAITRCSCPELTSTYPQDACNVLRGNTQ